MAEVQLSGPLPPEQFTQTLYSRHHGTEVGIRADTDGSAFGITLPPAGDVAEFGSATVDSICKVGGYPLIIPAGTTQSVTIDAPLSGGTTGRTDLIVARFAPATYTTAPGPVRLARIAGTPGSLTVPSYNPVTELPMWSVRRRQGEALNQAIAVDLRWWTGRAPIIVASGAPLPLTAPLGARATRDGITYRRDFVGSALDWVQENFPRVVLNGASALASFASGWQRQDATRMERYGADGKRRHLHLEMRRIGAAIVANSQGGGFADALMATLLDADKPAIGSPITMTGTALAGEGNAASYMALGGAWSTGSLYLTWLAPTLTLATGNDVRFDAYWSVA